MKNVVLDSYALLAFLFKERGHPVVLDLLERAAQSGEMLYLAAPNWAEVAYMVCRKAGEEAWNQARPKLLSLPIEIVPADQELAELAGEFKLKARMSLADCFAAALAKRCQGEIYTGDPEFREVEPALKIHWL